MMSLWDALRMNMMISYQELVRTFPNVIIMTSGTSTAQIIYDSFSFTGFASHSRMDVRWYS